MNIASSIREYLNAHGIRQTFVAERCGWSRQKINAIMCSKQRITADEYAAICDALEVPYDYFYNAATLKSS